MNYLTSERARYNAAPQPTWSRIKLPEVLFGEVAEHFKSVVVDQTDALTVQPLRAVLEQEQAICGLSDTDLEAHLALDRHAKQGLGESFSSYINSHFNHGLIALAPENSKAELHIAYRLTDDNPQLVDHHLIVAKRGAVLDVVIDYHSAAAGCFQHYGTVKVIAEPGAVVKVTKIQRLNDESHSFDQAFSWVGEGAQTTINDAQIGADVKAFANVQTLEGFRADAQTYSLYYGQPASGSDIAYTMRHIGKKSTSTILSKGALLENSKKVFRGNLVFERGSTGAVGREEEFVVLLSEKLKSDSIPGLFCQEDDVIGEHAASIGQVDQDMLFYMMSRGLTETEARRLVVKSSYQAVIDKMAVGDTAQLIVDELDQRIN